MYFYTGLKNIEDFNNSISSRGNWMMLITISKSIPSFNIARADFRRSSRIAAVTNLSWMVTTLSSAFWQSNSHPLVHLNNLTPCGHIDEHPSLHNVLKQLWIQILRRLVQHWGHELLSRLWIHVIPHCLHEYFCRLWIHY